MIFHQIVYNHFRESIFNLKIYSIYLPIYNVISQWLIGYSSVNRPKNFLILNKINKLIINFERNDVTIKNSLINISY